MPNCIEFDKGIVRLTEKSLREIYGQFEKVKRDYPTRRSVLMRSDMENLKIRIIFDNGRHPQRDTLYKAENLPAKDDAE